jgi:hypothetical protein
MGLLNILLKDNKNNICQKMLSLREETELLICENINTINKKELFLSIKTIDFGYSTLDLEHQGWKVDDGLYDKLIIEYNNSSEKEKLLKFWK